LINNVTHLVRAGSEVAAGKSIGPIFCEIRKRLNILENKVLPSSADETAILPRPHEPADRKERRTGHLSDVLTGNRGIDLDAPLHRSSRIG
jgi:hypothetical protein